jgi:medium-chain acyl-[acyl-carrier-protein] hydrolase
MKTRLLCFPSAGAGAVSYRTWLNAFPHNVEVVPIELPGRGARIKESLFFDVRALAGALISGSAGHFNEPYAVFGHSVGALLAYEVVRLVERAPVHFFASAHRSPDYPQTAPILHDLSDDALCRELKSLGGLNEALSRERDVMRLLLPAIRADLRMTETYQPDREPFILPCPITAYAGVADELVPAAHMEGWRLHTARSFHLNVMQGGHFYLQQFGCPLTSMLAASLKDGMALREP